METHANGVNREETTGRGWETVELTVGGQTHRVKRRLREQTAMDTTRIPRSLSAVLFVRSYSCRQGYQCRGIQNPRSRPKGNTFLSIEFDKTGNFENPNGMDPSTAPDQYVVTLGEPFLVKHETTERGPDGGKQVFSFWSQLRKANEANLRFRSIVLDGAEVTRG